MIEITEYQLKVCLEALKIAEDTVQNDSKFGSVIVDLLLKIGE